jgi:hypothetical protein
MRRRRQEQHDGPVALADDGVLVEFTQLVRDRLTYAMIIGVPVFQLLLFGYADQHRSKASANRGAGSGPGAIRALDPRLAPTQRLFLDRPCRPLTSRDGRVD